MRNYLLLLLLACCSCVNAQDTVDRLDKYFSNVPLHEGFETWIEHIKNDPYLRLDSFNERGIYSSFKPGIKSQFPFPDSIRVKLLIQKTVYYDPVTNISTDSTNEISIEGIFADDRSGRKGSQQCFKNLRKQLRKNYRHEEIEYFANGSSSLFIDGKNGNFPSCDLSRAYSDELKFYFVMITYTSPRTNRSVRR